MVVFVKWVCDLVLAFMAFFQILIWSEFGIFIGIDLVFHMVFWPQKLCVKWSKR